jgi:integrase/recombinase XerD
VTLSLAIREYVQRKRKEGHRFDKGEQTLILFLRRVGDIALERVKTRHILEFLDGPRTSTVTWRGKHSLLRHFFEHWSARDAMPELLMPTMRPPIPCTFTPYIYSRGQIKALARATRSESGTGVVDDSTMRALILFLYATGVRLGEALALRRENVDLIARKMHVGGGGRFSRSRHLPIGRDLARVLGAYLKSRNRRMLGAALVFSRVDGGELKQRALAAIFRRLCLSTGIARCDGAVYQPRMHDLRSTFAVHRLTTWLKSGARLGRMMPALAAYLGQQELASTDRYLLLAPERFRKELDKLSPMRGKQRWRNDAKLMKFLASL